MRRLALIACLALLAGCAATGANGPRAILKTDRDTALLRDARECEEDADAQLQNAGQIDPGIRLLYFQAHAGLPVWEPERGADVAFVGVVVSAAVSGLSAWQSRRLLEDGAGAYP